MKSKAMPRPYGTVRGFFDARRGQRVEIPLHGPNKASKPRMIRAFSGFSFQPVLKCRICRNYGHVHPGTEVSEFDHREDLIESPWLKLFGLCKSSKHARTTAHAIMPPHQDRHEVGLKLVTIAGTEYAMQVDLSHYEDPALDDILCFLPVVFDLEVFGCELELLDPHTQQPLTEAFHTVLLQRPQLQIVVRPCMVDGHSIWQFQEDFFFFHEYGRHVGMMPRTSLKEGKYNWMVKKRTKTTQQQTKQNQSPQAETPPPSSISSVLG